MRITMTEAEIKASITASIEAQGFNLSGKFVEIDLKATRGDAGYTAEIDITNEGEAPAAPAKASLEIEKKVSAAKAEPKKTEAPANDAAEEAEEQPPFETEEAEQADAEEETADADEAPASSARKSLFGDAKRPVNA